MKNFEYNTAVTEIIAALVKNGISGSNPLVSSEVWSIIIIIMEAIENYQSSNQKMNIPSTKKSALVKSIIHKLVDDNLIPVEVSDLSTINSIIDCSENIIEAAIAVSKKVVKLQPSKWKCC